MRRNGCLGAYETATGEYLFVEDQDVEQARSERPPPGAAEVVSRPVFQDESPPTAPSGLHEQEEDGSPAGEYVDEEEEIAPARIVNTRVIEIDRFISAGEVDGSYFEKPYYIVPRGEMSQEAFAVIREAMARENVVGLARIILSSRERPFLIAPSGMGLRGHTLRFVQDVRPQQEFFEDTPSIKLSAQMIKLAQRIIRMKSAEFDPSMLVDHYRTALKRILNSKQVTPSAPASRASPSRENVINLMEALRRSIASQPRATAQTKLQADNMKRPTREPKKKGRLDQ